MELPFQWRLDVGLPPVSQTWTFSLNNVYTFTSVIGATGDLMFLFAGVGGFLPSTMGYTVKGSCDGTTGAMDGVNRITSAAQWGTRSNGAGGAQSWIVLTDGAGIDWCFSFNSSSDDIVRLAHSQGGNYVAAGTPSQQPTAIDECFDAASGTWVNSTASANRVFQFWGGSDKKIFRLAVYRSSVLAAYIKGEKFTSGILAPTTFSEAVGGGTVAAIKSYYNGTTLTGGSGSTFVQYAVANAGDACRAHVFGIDANVLATVGGLVPGGHSGPLPSGNFGPFAVEQPALQGGTGELMFPHQIGSTTGNVDGKLGSLFDSWFAITNSSSVPALGDTFGTLQFFVVGSGGHIVPWDGATTPQVA